MKPTRSNRERDILPLSTLIVPGGCIMTKVHFYFDQRSYSLHL